MNSGSNTTSTTDPERLVDAVLPLYDELKGFFCRRLHCRHDADDLVQQTMERVLCRVCSGTVANPRGFVFRVARNLLIDRIRRETLCPWDLSDDVESERAEASGLTPADSLEAGERLCAVRGAIAALPPRCREVFILNRFEGLSYAAIARRLNIAESTVEKHMIRAIASCRAAVET